MKVRIAQINPTIGDISGNEELVKKALTPGADLVLFPELTLCGYPPEDFLLHDDFIDACQNALERIVPFTMGLTAIIGLPRKNQRKKEKKLFNSAAIVQNGKILGYQDKQLLPTYDVFDERRYFEAGLEYPIYLVNGEKVIVTICEDLWQHSRKVFFTDYNADPVLAIKAQEPDLVVNLSASPYHYGKYEERKSVVAKAAKTLNCPVILTNQVGGQDSLIFDGYSLACNEKGELIARAQGFEEELLVIDTQSPAQDIPPPDPIADLYQALVLGIRDYFHKSGFKKACLGLSGGIDSAVAACLGRAALGSENMLGVAMPSRYSSEGSLIDAKALAHNLKIPLIEIPIEKPFQSYLDLLHPFFNDKPADLTEENLQARIRGQILMALSNKHGYIVLSTGNKSELAMGYSTLYGDLTGGLSALADVSKNKVYKLARYINQDSPIIPQSTIDKPPSAELRPGQKDSDSLPPYPVIDQVLEGYVEQSLSPEQISEQYNISLAIVLDLVKKIHFSEYKRRQAPPGLRVSEKSFSVGRRFPIVQKFIKG